MRGGSIYVRANGDLKSSHTPVIFVNGGPGASHEYYLPSLVLADQRAVRSKRLRTHTAIIFLSLLGGVALFGAPGVILGPLTFSLAASLIDIWRSER